ncbi:hypothetical protein EXM65_12660 [Clostridium botulinum]|uniref:Uncharacterized protein n=1 Tax=Clostridium botulinum TaxID=1491 RepID=A0A6M0SQ17_CLOBO|nr:hypothetical protein [Clostridium botulinum]
MTKEKQDYNKDWYENNKDKQQEYNKAYAKNNPEHSRYLKARSAARSFIKTKATLTDLEELKKIIEEKEKELNK